MEIPDEKVKGPTKRKNRHPTFLNTFGIVINSLIYYYVQE